LFLAFLALFAISPIVEAYTYSLFAPLILLTDQKEPDGPVVTDELNLNDNLNFLDAVKSSEKVSEQNHALVQTSHYGTPGRIENIQTSAYDIKSSQSCPPISSDLSPPLV
jgi:hypothetical protein